MITSICVFQNDMSFDISQNDMGFDDIGIDDRTMELILILLD